MALLSETRGLGWPKVLIGVVLITCAGCVLIDALRDPERAFAFSHEIHVEEEGLECINCHENASAFDEPGMPTVDSCFICHDILDEEKDPERRIDVLFDEDGNFLSTRACELETEVVFEHLRHVEAVGDCGACHEDIEQNQKVGEELAVFMDDCTSCHGESAVSNDCSTCHSDIQESWMPDTHHHNWKSRHGKVCRQSNPEPINRCSLCHEDSSCEQCHMVEQPENHNAFWRLRGHAVVARMKRQDCATCHQPYSCDACHSEFLPQNHTGMWGGTRSTHCLTCHFPLQQVGCVTCHKETPSHFLAPPKPAWHEPTFDCRQCHGFGQLPLTHVDDGSNCNICHL